MLLRSTSCTRSVLGILTYSPCMLRFLRSVRMQPVFARDAFSEFPECG